MTTPNEIEQDIERTRGQLSDHVDMLSEKVSPGKVLGRQVDSVKTRATTLKDRFIGSSDDGGGLRGAGDTLASKASGLSSKASDLGDAAAGAPQALRTQAQGNPLAVGLIAFGVGWLLSSAAPASAPEQQLAAKAESKAKELAEPLKQAGQDIAENLKPAVQDSVEQIKSTATDAAQQTAEHAQSAAQDVKAPLQQ